MDFQMSLEALKPGSDGLPYTGKSKVITSFWSFNMYKANWIRITSYNVCYTKLLRHTYGVDRFTSKSNDWEKFIVIPAKDYAHAIRIERAIKSKKSSIFIRNLKKYTELKQKIIDQTSTWLSR